MNMVDVFAVYERKAEAEGRAEGRAEGETIGIIKFALKHGMSVEDIAEETNMTVDELLDFCDRHEITLP